jgi:hypothetical protein
LNVVATGKPPMSSVMPAPGRSLPVRPSPTGAGSDVITIGVLDSGLAGGPTNGDGMRPALFGTSKAALARITGELDVPSQPIGHAPADNYLDPVAGHGTFIAGIVEQLTPGCTIDVRSVFEPQGDVDVGTLAAGLLHLMATADPVIVNFSFGGTGRDIMFASVIDHYHEHHGVVFVGAAGNEGSCVEQYPAALPSVIGVAALGPTGPGTVLQLRAVGRCLRARHRHREFVLREVRRRPSPHQRDRRRRLRPVGDVERHVVRRAGRGRRAGPRDADHRVLGARGRRARGTGAAPRPAPPHGHGRQLLRRILGTIGRLTPDVPSDSLVVVAPCP